MKYSTHTSHTHFSQSFSEKLLGGKMHLMDQCHEVQKLPKEVQQKPDRRYTQSQEVQRKPDRRYTQSQTRDTLYNKPNEVRKKVPVEIWLLVFLEDEEIISYKKIWFLTFWCNR